jgi:hypothetical protein
MPWFNFSVGTGGDRAEPLQSVAHSTEFPAPTFAEALDRARTMANSLTPDPTMDRVCLSRDGAVLWSSRRLGEAA